MDHEKILSFVREIDNLESVQKVSSPKRYRDHVVSLTIDFIYMKEHFLIHFTNTFPYHLPYIVAQKPFVHPHIDSEGYICYYRTEDVEYDPLDERELIQKVFVAFKRILNMDDMEQKSEYLVEYPDYFRQMQNADTSRTMYLKSQLDKLETPCKVSIKKTKSNDLIVYDKLRYHNKTLHGMLDKVTENQVINGLLISVDRPPNMNEYTSMKQLDFVPCMSDTELRKTKNIKIASEQYVIVRYPIDDTRYRYIAFTLEAKRNDVNNIFCLDEEVEIQPITVKVSHPKFLRERGSSGNYSANVLIVGAGSLGSETVYHMAKAGFTQITVVDDDMLDVNNTYRHFLGYEDSFLVQKRSSRNAAFNLKVVLLKTEIEKRYPDVSINVHAKNIVDLIENGHIDLTSYDYVISTIGNIVANRYINDHCYKDDSSNRLIFAWLEPFGIGLHTLNVNTNQKGCLNCLQQSSNRIRFANPNDNYVIRNDNCIGSYTIFGSLAVSRLAINLVESMIRYAEGTEDFRSKHIVYKGDFHDFIYEGCVICGNNPEK